MHSTCRAGHEQETTQTLQDEERTIEGSARERHGLFRCGAFRAARIRRPSIQYSGVVFPPGPNSWPLNIPSACSVPITPLPDQRCNAVSPVCHIPPGKLLGCLCDLPMHSSYLVMG